MQDARSDLAGARRRIRLWLVCGDKVAVCKSAKSIDNLRLGWTAAERQFGPRSSVNEDGRATVVALMMEMMMITLLLLLLLLLMAAMVVSVVVVVVVAAAMAMLLNVGHQ